MMASGTLSSSFAWAVNEYSENTTLFTRVVFATVILTTAVLSLLLWSGKVPIRIVQELLYVVIGGVLLSVMFYALYADIGDGLRDVSLFSMYLFLPFLYIFVFLAYEERGALVRSLVVFGLSVGISLPALLDPRQHTQIVVPNTLGLSYLAAVLIIAQLFLLSRLKESLTNTELAAAQMERLAKVDPLTSALNRRGFGEIMDGLIAEALKKNEPLALIVFDLDDFKSLNDRLGHDAGDEALVRVARTVEAELRSDDALARWGGEEFAVLCPGASSDEGYMLAERLRHTVRELRLSVDWSLSASFGVSTLSLGGTKDDLIKQADTALYVAKGAGKDRTVLYGSDPPDELSRSPAPVSG